MFPAFFFFSFYISYLPRSPRGLHLYIVFSIYSIDASVICPIPIWYFITYRADLHPEIAWKWGFQDVSVLFPIKKPECDSGFVILVKMIFVLELLNSSTTIDELLLTCKERVTRWTNIGSDLRLYWPGHKCISACASYFTVHVFWMDSFLHAVPFFPARTDPSSSYAHRDRRGGCLWHDSFTNISQKSRRCKRFSFFALDCMVRKWKGLKW